MTDKEDKQVGASYIITFYQDVANLTHHHVQYCNFLTELSYRFGNDASLEKMDDGYKNALMLKIQELRYFAQKAYIEYFCVVTSSEKEKPDPDITIIYEKIRDQFVISRENSEKFIVAINKALISKVMRELLETSKDFMQEVYKS